jgi:FlaA1/EpsC-like NDP-sugar epimerase/lipopolysaccharide/colanic/teichoic acid biosynthesis glycosyltransferase
MIRRSIDAGFAALAFVLALPVLIVCVILVKLDTRGPALYTAPRVGRGGREFRIYKLRTMRAFDAAGPRVTAADDPRITRVGRRLRRWKVDELPQLFNVLRGDMALVGPRPEDPRYVRHYTEEQRRLLETRPGITSLSTLAYSDEEVMLAGGDAERLYLDTILPAKLRIELDYLRVRTAISDMRVLARTLASLFRGTSPRGSRMTPFVRQHVPWLAIDMPIVVVSYVAAFMLRFLDGPAPPRSEGLAVVLSASVLLAPLYVLFNSLLRVNRREWRFATAAEVRPIAISCFLATVFAALFDTIAGLNRDRPVPLSIVLLGGFFTFSGFVGVRYRARLLQRMGGRRRGSATRTLICGAGQAAQALALRLLTYGDAGDVDIIGYIDEDPRSRGMSIHNIRVLGSRKDLASLVLARKVELIVLALDHVAGEEIRDILTIAEGTSAQIKIAPAIHDWLTAGSSPLRELRAEDLLGRAQAATDLVAAELAVKDRTVLVTGACGSIGSELCRQIAGHSPARLVAFDSNESGLYDLEIELHAAFPDAVLTTVVGDVTHRDTVRGVLGAHHPEVLFHVAAYKHVPLMERFPHEAIKVNVLGTWTVLDEARLAGVSRFVFVSTDKAVNPSSVMGATKRLAERLVASRATEGTVCTAVRFGNVLGSRGSVVPTFTKQIDMGGPVTVTDPRMTRYFMDESEAASLIIQAAGLTTGGEIFMLDMGQSIRIDDLARKMIRMRGLRPGVDIEIRYTGIRPGEKLHEELTHTEEMTSPTAHPLIRRVTRHEAMVGGEARELLARVEGLLLVDDAAEVADKVRALAGDETAATGRRPQRARPAPMPAGRPRPRPSAG